jgi:hypothetical protein
MPEDDEVTPRYIAQTAKGGVGAGTGRCAAISVAV